MKMWLFKEEPSHFCYADLEKAGSTKWEGVSNAMALIHLRKCKKGDRVLFYHTGKEKAVVGEMKITRGPSAKAIASKQVTVEVRPVCRFDHPVSLATIRADPIFKDWELVRLSRLSVMPVSKVQWNRIEELARGTS